MTAAPLVPAACGMVVGIAFDAWCPVGWAWYIVAFFLAAGALGWRRERERYATAIAVIAAACLGGLLHDRAYRHVGANHVAHLTAPEPIIARLRGTVITRPRIYPGGYPPFEGWSFEPPHTSFFVEVDSIEGTEGFVSATGRVRATVKQATLAIAEGHRVELFGYLYRPSPPANPGQVDWSLRDRRNGVFAGISCRNAHSVQRLPENDRGFVRRTWAGLRRRTRSLLLGEMQHYASPEMSLLDAMVLGQRGAIDRDLNAAFVRAGCSHFLAVSGMHVCMLGAFFWFAGRLAGVSRRGCAVMAIVVTLLYAFIVEPRAPIFRAAVMTTVYCLSLLFYSPRNTANTIALAAIIILCWQPTALFGAGFQLSFAAVLGIVYLSGPIEGLQATLARRVLRRPADSLYERAQIPHGRWARLSSMMLGRRSILGRYVIRGIPISIAAWLAGSPLIMIYYERLSCWGWLNTILVAPLVFLVLVAAFLKVLCGLAFPGLSGLLTPIVEFPASVLTGWVDVLSRLPGVSVYVPSRPPTWWAALFYLVLAAWVCTYRRPGWWRKASGWILDAADRFRSQHMPPRRRDALTVTVLPVGHGCSTVVELPGGAVLLYDAGRMGGDGTDDSAVTTFLRHRGIDRVALLLISHPHRDHFRDVPSVMETVDTGPIGITPYFETLGGREPFAAELLRRLRQQNHPIRVVSGDSPPLRIDGAQIEFLWPPADAPLRLDANNSSLVVRIHYENRSVLLCGDIRDDAQAWLAHQADVAADVVLLPHHGAVTKATPRFVTETQATHLVCSRAVPDGAIDDPLAPFADRYVIHDTSKSQPIEISVAGGDVTVGRIDLPTATGPRAVERRLAWTLTAALALGTVIWQWPTGSRDALTMTVLSVGRATATVLELPDGQTLLYDCGATGGYDPGASVVVPYLRHGGVRRVDEVFVSHPNLDHFGGLPTVVDRVSTGPIRVSPYFAPLSQPNRPSRALLDALRERNRSVEPVSSEHPPMRFGDVTVDVLWPPPEAPFELDSNDSSLVLRVRYAGTSILLTGDIEDAAQQWLLENADVSADVLLLPHHGSVRPSTRAFLEAVGARYLIRSTFERNEVTFNGLLDLIGDRTLFNTADVGAVTVTVDRDGPRVQGFCSTRDAP